MSNLTRKEALRAIINNENPIQGKLFGSDGACDPLGAIIIANGDKEKAREYIKNNPIAALNMIGSANPTENLLRIYSDGGETYCGLNELEIDVLLLLNDLRSPTTAKKMAEHWLLQITRNELLQGE